jgi:hypothetical protein
LFTRESYYSLEAYKLEVNGERLVDWVTRLIEGKSVDDVHCQKCRAE